MSHYQSLLNYPQLKYNRIFQPSEIEVMPTDISQNLMDDDRGLVVLKN